MPTVLGPTTCMPLSRHSFSRRTWRARPASPVRPSPKPPLISRQKGTPRREAASTASKATYPEYDRLWRGGVEKDKVVISMVSGVMADWAAGEKPELADDIGYHMFYQQMAEVEKQLFDPFFSTKETGTGLGLSIAARLVEKLGGALRYETRVGHGTTFGIVLPRVPSATSA